MKTGKVDKRRIRTLKSGTSGDGPVIYVMARDQRVVDNWALVYAQQAAIENSQPLIVVACPLADYPEASFRQVDFTLSGLETVEKKLERLNIPMFIQAGNYGTKLPALIRRLKPSALVLDFSPLKENRRWKEKLTDQFEGLIFEVDAHNIVPVWEASPKLEYAAYTIRPKINRLLPDFLTNIPIVKKHPVKWSGTAKSIDWRELENTVRSVSGPSPVDWIKPGEDEAQNILKVFLSRRLAGYYDKRNDPNARSQSDLSPFLHFGQISAQRVALEVQRRDKNIKSQEAFIEELIIRRELSDNFCYYNSDYDSFDGFPDWARKTLDGHRSDPRPYIYTGRQFEQATTHDDLWNAAQLEMVRTGKMHGYMRMYWAKKILEWSRSPEEALDTAIYLNDKYELDGRDPNGYAGMAWSIGGVHDRPWFEREIFGKVRYMSYGGCKRKFDINQYIDRINALDTTGDS
jgi:deoxyribodipyrimidine photo-lyase